MQRGKINRWVAIVGFATLAVGLALETLGGGVAILDGFDQPSGRVLLHPPSASCELPVEDLDLSGDHALRIGER